MKRRFASRHPVSPAGRALTAIVVIGITTASSLVLPASAENEIVINPKQVVRAEPGALVLVAEQAVAAELVGRTCELRITTDNGSSVHVGNAIVTTTGDSRIETPGVEEDTLASVVDTQQVTLGETFLVQLRMGPEGLSSLGFDVSVDCPDPPAVPELVEREPPAAEQTEDPAPTTTVPPPTVPPLTSLPESPPAPSQIGTPTFAG